MNTAIKEQFKTAVYARKADGTTYYYQGGQLMAAPTFNRGADYDNACYVTDFDEPLDEQALREIHAMLAHDEYVTDDKYLASRKIDVENVSALIGFYHEVQIAARGRLQQIGEA